MMIFILNPHISNFPLQKLPPPQCIRIVSYFSCCPYTTNGLPLCSAGKESACNAGDLGLIPGSGRSPGEGKGYPLQYSGLENATDCIAHGVTKSQT